MAVETVAGYLEEWLGDAQYLGQSKATIEGKRNALRRLLWFLERSKLARCGKFEIKRFCIYVKNGHLEPLGRWDSNTTRAFLPVGDRVIQLYFVYIRTYFDWLTSEEIIAANPLKEIKAPTSKRARVAPLSIEEVQALLAAIPQGLNRARNEAILYLLLDSGVRVAELCSLKVGDMDLARRTAVVVGKGNKEREIYFGPDTARVIKRYLAKWPREASQKLFYSERPTDDDAGISTSGVQRMLQSLAKFAGISGKRVSPHTFRHTFATEFIRAGGSPKALQMILGHNDMTMTYRYVTLADADAAQQHRAHSPARLLRKEKRRE